MILPPVEIKIKRKRTDEPVDILHIQEPLGKKQRCVTDFVFCRQSIANLKATETYSASSKAVLTIKSSAQPSSSTLKTDSCQKSKELPKNDYATKPRHFHIYHPATTSGESSHSEPFNRKRKADTVFVEHKPISIRKPRFDDHVVLSTVSQLISKPNATQPTEKSDLENVASRSLSRVSNSLSPYNVYLSSGETRTEGFESCDVLAEIQEYSLSKIGKDVDVSKEELFPQTLTPEVPVACTNLSTIQHTRFKPKVPKLRCKDRQRNGSDLNGNIDFEVTNIALNEDSNDDWVVDKYLRVPLEATQIEDYVSHGYLILDSLAEVEEFYEDETDSEYEDDEDENAENHYSADYPDEEVESDDEFDRNIYHYAHDLNEFETDALSDDELDEKMKYPWLQNPWTERHNNLNVDHQDGEYE